MTRKASPQRMTPSTLHSKTRVANRLWRHRKIRALTQWQVALLLGHRKAAHVSRWENGKKLPTLPNALMLGYILRAPVEVLFADLAESLGHQVRRREAALKKVALPRNSHHDHQAKHA